MTMTALPREVLGMILTKPAITTDPNSLIHCSNVNKLFKELINQFLKAHPHLPSPYRNITLDLFVHSIHDIKDLKRCVRYFCKEKMLALKIDIFGSNHFGSLEITRNNYVIKVWASSQVITPDGQNPFNPDTLETPLDYVITGHGVKLKTQQNAAAVQAIQEVLAQQSALTWPFRRIRNNYVPY